MTDWQAVSARIRERREALGLTQAQLGELVGSSANYVAQVEGGLPLHEKKLAVYGRALGLSVPFLRYGVVSSVDVEALRAQAREEGRRSMLSDLSSWVEAQRAPVHEAPLPDGLHMESAELTLEDALGTKPSRSGRKKA